MNRTTAFITSFAVGYFLVIVLLRDLIGTDPWWAPLLPVGVLFLLIGGIVGALYLSLRLRERRIRQQHWWWQS